MGKGQGRILSVTALLASGLLWTGYCGSEESFSREAAMTPELQEQRQARLAEWRKQRHESAMKSAAREGLPPALMNIAMVYSGFSAEDVTKAALVVAKQKTPQAD